MSEDLADKLLRIKNLKQEATEEKNKAKGALSQTMSDLQREFGCKTIAAAEKEASKLKTTEANLRRKLEKETDKFLKEFDQWIDDDD